MNILVGPNNCGKSTVISAFRILDVGLKLAFAKRAGYLIGYVDEHLCELFTDDKSKSKYAKRIYEGIFPGAGVKLIQSKLAARRVSETISTDSNNYTDVFMGCQDFDTGVSAGRYEVCEYLANGEYTPNKLERYLSTGQIE